MKSSLVLTHKQRRLFPKLSSSDLRVRLQRGSPGDWASAKDLARAAQTLHASPPQRMTRGAISKARHDARHDAQLALHGILNQQWLSCRIASLVECHWSQHVS
jgi:hypothetical protein